MRYALSRIAGDTAGIEWVEVCATSQLADHEAGRVARMRPELAAEIFPYAIEADGLTLWCYVVVVRRRVTVRLSYAGFGFKC